LEVSLLGQIDPTDHAPEVAAADEQAAASSPPEAAGYSKIGPGPLTAIRFKWTVRREDNDNYYVDETIGEHSLPIITGPMSAAAAIRLVDEREQEAVRRFERLRGEIVGRSPDETLPQQGQSEA
jgi:hypothetical protein